MVQARAPEGSGVCRRPLERLITYKYNLLIMKHLSTLDYASPWCRIMGFPLEAILCTSGPNSAPNVIFDENEEEYSLS